MKAFITLFLAIIVLAGAKAQPHSGSPDSIPSLKDIRHGTFYSYQSRPGNYSISFVEGNRGYSIAPLARDTVVQSIEWVNDSVYKTKYVSGGSRLNPDLLKFNKEHVFWRKIEMVTPKYAVVSAHQNHLSGRLLHRDTVWFEKDVPLARSRVVENISTLLGPGEHGFTEKSEYALLYVYRPKKTGLWWAFFPLFIDERAHCIMMSNSGYVYRINREGLHTLRTKLYDSECVTTLDVKFGQRYYVRPIAEQGEKPNFNHYRLSIEKVERGVGEYEFNEVKLR